VLFRSYNNARDAVSLTPRRQVEPLLLPDQFMNLPRLTAYIKFPDGFPAAPVSLIPRSRDRIAEGFIPREKPSSKSAKGTSTASAEKRKARPETDGEHPATNDDGAGKPVDPKQLKLNLAGRDSPLVEARNHQQADSREQLQAWHQAGAARSRADGNAVVAASATLPPSAVQTGDSSLVEAGKKDLAEAGSASDQNPDKALPPAQERSRESERQPIKPAEKDLREGAVRDPPAKDLGEFEPDM